MKYLAAIALITVIGVNVQADENAGARKLAGQDDMTKDYLEKVTDEMAADRLRREKDRKDHEKYLREISRSR